jgi:hypothetical protein
MSEESVYGNTDLTEAEWELVDTAKRTIAILARVTRHKVLANVKADIDPAGEMDPGELEALAQKHLTPDLPGITEYEEAIGLIQLAPAIFRELRGF